MGVLAGPPLPSLQVSLATDNWVTPPNMKYFKVLVPTVGNIFDQNDEVKRVRTPPFAIHLAVT